MSLTSCFLVRRSIRRSALRPQVGSACRDQELSAAPKIWVKMLVKPKPRGPTSGGSGNNPAVIVFIHDLHLRGFEPSHS